MKSTVVALAFLLSLAAFAQEPASSGGDARQSQFKSLLEAVGRVLENLPPDAPTDTSSDTATLSITMRDAVSRAIQRNPQIFITTEDVNIRNAQVGQARAALFPQLGASTSFNWQEERVPGVSDGFFTNLVAPGSFDVKDIVRTDVFTFEQLLYSGGSTLAAIDAAEYLAESEEWRREAVKDALEFQVKQAYYDCLTAGALIIVAEDSIITFQRHLDDTELKLNVGETSRSEVIRARTELGSRRTDLVIARNRERIAYTILRKLIHTPQDTPLNLTDTVEALRLDGNPQEFSKLAIELRPETRALNLALLAAQKDRRRVKGQYWPSAGLQGNWSQADGAGSFSLEGWSVTLGISVDIYSGGKRKFEKVESEARIRQIEYQLEDIRSLIETEVVQAFIQVQDGIATMRSEQGNVELAEESQRLARLRFNEGIGIQADVLDAQLSMTNAQTQLVLATREYAVAHAALDKAIGRSWTPRDTANSD